MLVVTANWLFGDGTLATAAPAPRVAPWLQAVHRAALRGGFRRDGSYRPLESVQIVLAGDTFDCLTSSEWTGAVRPWHAGRAAQAARRRVLFRSASRGRRLLARLGRWARDGLVVPAADRRGRPVLGTTACVPLRVVLLAGDRDAWLHEGVDEATRHGLALGHVWSDDAATIRHGADCDPCAEAAERRWVGGRGWQPTLAESIAVDLVARFVAAIVSSPHAAACRSLVAEFVGRGPLEIAPVVERTLDVLAAGGDRDHVRDAVLVDWRRSVAAWHRETVRQPPACAAGFAACDALAGVFDSAGRGVVSGAAASVAARLAARTVAEPGGHTVLGHPSGAEVDAAGAERLICLGDGPLAAWGMVPRTVVRRDDGCRTAWERLQLPGMPEPLGVEPARPAAATIVDAA